MVPDDGLVQRLLDAGVSTTGEEIEQTSTLVSILAWVLPIIIFVALGQYMSRKMMEKLGGGGNRSAAAVQFKDISLDEAVKKIYDAIDEYMG